MRKMIDSGVTWIGEIPYDWPLVRFKDKYVNIKEVAKERSVEFERLALTLNGVVKRPKDDSEGLQPKEFDGYQILRKNDFVFKMIDLQNVSTSRVGLSPYTGLVSPAYIRFSPKEPNQYNQFVYYYLMSLYYNCVYNNLGGNGVRSALNGKDMGEFVVPYPSESEQRTIGDFLDEKCSQVDALIVNVQAQIEKLKAYKQSMITEKIAPQVGWSQCRLGQIANFKNGLNYNGLSTDIEIKFLGVGDFQQNFRMDKPEMFSNLKFNGDIPKDLFLENGDIVFVRSNGSKELVGRSVFIDNVDYPLTYSGFCIRMRNHRKDIIRSEFLMYYFWSHTYRQTLNQNSRGTNISNLNQEMLSALEIHFPSIELQNEIVDSLNKLMGTIDRLIAIKQEKIEKLEQYKKSLIYEYVTGKKEVL